MSPFRMPLRPRGIGVALPREKSSAAVPRATGAATRSRWPLRTKGAAAPPRAKVAEDQEARRLQENALAICITFVLSVRLRFSWTSCSLQRQKLRGAASKSCVFRTMCRRAILGAAALKTAGTAVHRGSPSGPLRSDRSRRGSRVACQHPFAERCF
jgi:hypothetical protein